MVSTAFACSFPACVESSSAMPTLPILSNVDQCRRGGGLWCSLRYWSSLRLLWGTQDFDLRLRPQRKPLHREQKEGVYLKIDQKNEAVHWRHASHRLAGGGIHVVNIVTLCLGKKDASLWMRALQ